MGLTEGRIPAKPTHTLSDDPKKRSSFSHLVRFRWSWAPVGPQLNQESKDCPSSRSVTSPDLRTLRKYLNSSKGGPPPPLSFSQSQCWWIFYSIGLCLLISRFRHVTRNGREEDIINFILIKELPKKRNFPTPFPLCTLPLSWSWRRENCHKISPNNYVCFEHPFVVWRLE